MLKAECPRCGNIVLINKEIFVFVCTNCVPNQIFFPNDMPGG